MLEKQPNLRISAEECLHHDFFVESMEIEEFDPAIRNPEELRVMGSTVPEATK
jgi:serine/threonine protein kinase